jgi:hypothetical protein
MLVAVAIAAGSPSPSQASQAATPSGDVSWASTGDSYSSGHGIPRASGGCYQSDQSWGPQAAKTLTEDGWRIPKVVFSACSGHLIGDFYNRRSEKEAGGVKGSLWEWTKEQAGSSDPKFDVLTLTFGGYNLDFARILGDCITGFTGFAELSQESILFDDCNVTEDALNQRVDDLAKSTLTIDDGGEGGYGQKVVGSFGTFYETIARRHLTERGQLIVVGYPRILSPSGEWGRWQGLRCNGITRGDANMLGRVVERLDGLLRSEVALANRRLGTDRIRFVSAVDLFGGSERNRRVSEGHELCGKGEDWLNGKITLGAKRATDLGSFHPTAKGYAAEAAEVSASLRNSGLPSAPKLTVRTGPVRPLSEADLLAAPVPSLCQHPAGTLVDGVLPGIPAQQGGVAISGIGGQGSPRVIFGDLTNDKVDEAVVIISCNRGGVSWPNPVLIYGAGPTLLATIDLPDIVPAWNSRASVQKLQIVDGKLLVDWLTGAEGDIGAGSTLEVSARLRLDGNKVAVEQLTKYEEGPVMEQLLTAINAGNNDSALRVADRSVVDEMSAWTKRFGRLTNGGCYGALRPGIFPAPMSTGRYCLVKAAGATPAYVGFGKTSGSKEYRAIKWSVAQLTPTTPMSPPCVIAGRTGRYGASNIRGSTDCNTATKVWDAYERAGGPGETKPFFLESWSCGLPDSDKAGVVALCRNNPAGVIFEVAES